MPRDRYALAELRADLARDVDAYLRFAAEYHAARPGWRRRLSALLMPSLQACLLHRVAHWLHRAGWRRLGSLTAGINFVLTRVSINPASRIGGGLYIAHPGTGIVFQGHAGRDLKLFAGCAASAGRFSPPHGHESDEMPRFGEDVSLGAKAFVIGPVVIGSHVRIGFNACVQQDLPDGVIVVASHTRRRVSAPGPAHRSPSGAGR